MADEDRKTLGQLRDEQVARAAWHPARRRSRPSSGGPMTPPEKLRQLADEMERAKAAGQRDLNQVVDWRNRLAEIIASMDAALDPIETVAAAARRRRRECR